MAITKVRVELRKMHPKSTRDDREKAFKSMLAAFKRQVNDSGVLTEFKDKQYFESPGEKRRKKNKEALLQRKKEENLKTKLRNHFGRG